ncbi:hypothetical protein [Gracilimonas tropica]|uniref:hypothetical protein n=1 Tax=Gracilimonas tropica TaxID=454600 RepID=UPI00037B3D91|nr:hypothetical protein [Gracilimonas tropica]
MSSFEAILDSKIKSLNLKFFSDYLNQLEEMYEAAIDLSSQYDSQIAKLAKPYNRDWLANQKLYETALMHDDCVANYVANSSGNHKHVEVRLDGAIITVSQVKYKNEFVRNAKFRQSLSQKYTPTFFDPNPSVSIGDEDIYVIILHGIISNENERPGFARIAVPNYENGRYDYNKSLYKICGLKEPIMIDEPVIEEIKNDNMPTLKKNIS